jgi:uncharacterized protein YndB with AHSA1/START domain
MTPRPIEVPAGEAGGYRGRLAIGAPRERVLQAIGTLDGPRHWWTTLVTGSTSVRGRLRLGFAGPDEQIVMRVDAVQPPAGVCWSCVAHTGQGEWKGSQVRFELAERGPRSCVLDFRHSGIDREAVTAGWDHFLASLVARAEIGEGTPFGT